MKRKGFTLIELIIVVIIVGILATLAIPQYTKAVERARWGKAKHALGLIINAEKMLAGETGSFLQVNQGAGPLNDSALGSYVELNDVDNDTDWIYYTQLNNPPGGTTCEAVAMRRSGTYKDRWIALDNTGAWRGTLNPD